MAPKEMEKEVVGTLSMLQSEPMSSEEAEALIIDARKNSRFLAEMDTQDIQALAQLISILRYEKDEQVIFKGESASWAGGPPPPRSAASRHSSPLVVIHRHALAPAHHHHSQHGRYRSEWIPASRAPEWDGDWADVVRRAHRCVKQG